MKRRIYAPIAVLLAFVLAFAPIPASVPMAGIVQAEAAKKIALNKTKIKLQPGGKATLKLKNAKASSVKWKSANKKVATVSSKGVVTGKAKGSTQVTAVYRKKSYTCTVVVNAPSENTPSENTPSENTPSQNPSSGIPYTQARAGEVYDRMMSLQTQYPEGKPWTNDNYYENKVTIELSDGMVLPPGCFGGYGCAGFAMLLQEYGENYEAPVRTMDASYSNIPIVRVGDVLRIANDMHSVVVLSVEADGHTVTVAEGNFNRSIHWGRVLDLSDPSVGLVEVATFWN